MVLPLRSVAQHVVALLVVAMVSVGLTGAHLHWAHGSPESGTDHRHQPHRHTHHHGAQIAGGHHVHEEGQVDLKVDTLTGQADRSGKFSPMGVALLLSLALPLVVGRRAVPRLPDRPALMPYARRYWRPQLRGPPVISIF